MSKAVAMGDEVERNRSKTTEQKLKASWVKPRERRQPV